MWAGRQPPAGSATEHHECDGVSLHDQATQTCIRSRTKWTSMLVYLACVGAGSGPTHIYRWLHASTLMDGIPNPTVDLAVSQLLAVVDRVEVAATPASTCTSASAYTTTQTIRQESYNTCSVLRLLQTEVHRASTAELRSSQ